jgi:DNA-binding beta-propeller fold protein YncE
MLESEYEACDSQRFVTQPTPASTGGHLMSRFWVTTLALLGGLIHASAARADDLYFVSQFNTGPDGTVISRVGPDAQASPFAAVSGNEAVNGMAFDRAGNLYLPDDVDDSVLKVTTAGSISTFAVGVFKPQSLAIDSSGNVFAINGINNTLTKITPQGEVSLFVSAGSLGVPGGIAADAAGFVYVSVDNTTTIRKFSPEGRGLGDITNPLLSSLRGLTFNAAGDLYFGGQDDNTIYRFSTAGKLESLFRTVSRPLDLAFDSTGRLYISEGDSAGTLIQRIGDNGKLERFGTISPDKLPSIAWQ